jgi:PPM family protein phosphatase
MIRWEVAGGTHVGRVRKGNEDSFRIDSERGIFVVADGMGGHAAGEVASALASDIALHRMAAAVDLDGHDLAAEISGTFSAAHRALIECCEGDPKTAGMGTTLTVLVLRPDGALYLGHLGDSRLYHLSSDSLRQLSRDHTWVQQEIDAGRVAPEAGRNHPFSHILTRVLSADEPAEPDVGCFTVRGGETLLACSDGLHNMVDGHELLQILSMGGEIEGVVEALIQAANGNGGTDNVTAVVIRVV